MTKASHYQFQAAAGVSNAPWVQWLRMVIAVFRIGWPLLIGNLQQAAVDTWAAKREHETMHRILAGKGVDLGMALDDVEDAG